MDKFSKVLRISYYIFSLMTAYDTALVIACLTYGSTMATFGNHTLSMATAIIITLAILWVIEVVSTVGMLPTLEAFQKGGSRAVKKGYYVALVYLALLSGASLSVSIFGRDYIAEVVIPIPAMIDDAGAVASIETSANATTAQLQGIIKTAQAERKKAIANASNSKLDALANSGNEWATATRNKLIEKAAAPYSTQIAAANAQLAEAMQSTQSAISGKRSEIANANSAALQSAERRRHLISTFLMWLSIGATVMMWITTITIVIWDASDGQLDGSIGNPAPTTTTTTANTNATQKSSPLATTQAQPSFIAKVATNLRKRSSYSVATEKKGKAQPDVYDLAIKNLRSNVNAWKSKLTGDAAKDVNAVQRIDEIEQRIFELRKEQSEAQYNAAVLAQQQQAQP